MGKLILTVAWIFALLRNIISDFTSINIANSMILVACCLETIAMLALIKTKAKRQFNLQIAITIITILAFNIGTFLGADMNSRVVIAGIAVFAIYLIPTILYLTEKDKGFFKTFYVLCYGGFEVLILIRTIYRYLYPEDKVISYGTLDSLYSICLFLLSLIGIVGFLLLVKEKQDQKIQKLLDDKNQFFSIISHDLRGPLGSSVSLSELFLENIEDYSREEIREISEMQHESNKNIYKLLENLLEWSRVQTGMITFSPKRLTLNTLIKENLELSKNAALNKNIKLIFESTDQIDAEVDKNMIGTILRNLLSNAIKFTEKNGEIKIKLLKANQQAKFSITDNGIGVPDSIKENLFRINEKVTQKGTENETGSGLGLLLCSEFIKIHNGKIWVESEAGEGSTFKFTLPLENI
ncbi:signal transduction histidine kinase [Flavobacterium nitrogenifigens]|uniref:histidine kinase n=2 Tax=Flavobacterium TaxID=237 RepID=A0A7W7IXE7_9FLAO|nr:MULTISPECIES: HAMP domain-containing sensor histidine kinase [Flavobacterium]MBB4802379.1 signal transduction histidine kinase [Flavobacterium nitrogenifigens]MBB6387337.1 signal transduction histidine kinase [Flavobacterium notoginsengisoli]